MAIFNTARSLNYEIRLYGESVQNVIVFGKARRATNDYDEKMEICERLINEVF